MDDGEVTPVPQLRREPAERLARSVLPACAVVWTAAEILHAAHVPWTDIGMGAALAAALAYGTTGHHAKDRKAARRHARHAAIATLTAGTWLAVAARTGPLAGPWCAMSLAWASLSLAGWAWLRRHELVIAARDWRAARTDWLSACRRWGLGGSHLLHHEQTRLGERMIADVTGTGRRASQIARGDVAERIAEDRGLPSESRVQVKVYRPGQIEISIRDTDPWAHPITHPVLAGSPEIDLSGPETCHRPWTVGQDPETGRPFKLTVWDEDGGKRVLLVATSRAGKTVLLNCLRERATKARDVLVVNLNLSKALEDKEWAPACHLTALTRHQTARALRILRLLVAVIEWRSQQPRETAVFQPSPGHPLILLIGDEIDALSRVPAARLLLKDIFSKGGSEGVAPVIAGQRGTTDWIGGGDVRALVDVFAIGQVGRRGEMMHAAGDLGLTMPDMASYGEGRKGVWAFADLGGETRTGRTFLLKEPADLRTLVEARARYQPVLEPELTAFLGESYENLLRTDAFARWAAEQEDTPVAAHPRPDMTPEAPSATPAAQPAPVAVLNTDDTLKALDFDAEATLDDELQQKLRKLDARNADTARILAENASRPIPEIDPDKLAAHTRARWDQEAEHTVIPDDMREKLLALVAGEGISARQAVNALGIPEAKRTKVTWWLNRLRWEGLVELEGKGRAARWKLAAPPAGGDGT